MTLEKASNVTFERHPFFITAEALVNDVVTVVSAPKIVTLKNGKQRLVVDVEIGKHPDYEKVKIKGRALEDIKDRKSTKVRTWFMNQASRNRAIDLLGNNENDWYGQEIPVEVVEQVINNAKTRVKYVKGSLKSYEEDEE